MDPDENQSGQGQSLPPTPAQGGADDQGQPPAPPAEEPPAEETPTPDAGAPEVSPPPPAEVPQPEENTGQGEPQAS